ncbi:MAG TPA: YihY/virulence factor BrkB family protein [Sporichthyaceae bacterium]|nr:YihY/virulence factor BrkB family protein [Sporichthyaceae bacterium]
MPIAVAYKFAEDDGGYLAALITFYGFVSLFPLLLLLTTALGFLLHGDRHLQQQLLDSALHQFPIIGEQIGGNVRAVHGSLLAAAIGLTIALLGALGVAQAVQYTLDTVWAVPRARRPGPVHSRLRSLWLLVVGGLGVAATTALSGLSAGASRYDTGAGAGLRTVAVIVGVALNAGLFLAVFRMLTARHVSTRQVVPGAVTAAVGWQLLQWVGTWFVSHELRGASGSYGIFGVVLGLLGFLYLAATLVVLCAELNVVLAHRLWPRALLAPFADDAELTAADRRAYTSYAQAGRHKAAQRIRVTYGPQPPTAERPDQADDHAGERSQRDDADQV